MCVLNSFNPKRKKVDWQGDATMSDIPLPGAPRGEENEHRKESLKKGTIPHTSEVW